MALQRPQITVCIDGKPHSWMIVAEEKPSSSEEVGRLEHRWCKKCGCLTQVAFSQDGQPTVAVDAQGAPYLSVPKIIKALIKE